jgi:hypothetical protein
MGKLRELILTITNSEVGMLKRFAEIHSIFFFLLPHPGLVIAASVEKLFSR